MNTEYPSAGGGCAEMQTQKKRNIARGEDEERGEGTAEKRGETNKGKYAKNSRPDKDD